MMNIFLGGLIIGSSSCSREISYVHHPTNNFVGERGGGELKISFFDDKKLDDFKANDSCLIVASVGGDELSGTGDLAAFIYGYSKDPVSVKVIEISITSLNGGGDLYSVRPSLIFTVVNDFENTGLLKGTCRVIENIPIGIRKELSLSGGFRMNVKISVDKGDVFILSFDIFENIRKTI